MRLYFESTVKITKHIIAYGIFDLIVEIGSSLGLWIGPSALGSVVDPVHLEPDPGSGSKIPTVQDLINLAKYISY